MINVSVKNFICDNFIRKIDFFLFFFLKKMQTSTPLQTLPISEEIEEEHQRSPYNIFMTMMIPRIQTEYNLNHMDAFKFSACLWHKRMSKMI